MNRTFKERVDLICASSMPSMQHQAASIASDADASLASKDAEIAQMYAAAGEAQAERDAARDERDALAAEVAALREDAERYRWMRRSLYWDGHAWWIPDLPVSSREGYSLSRSDEAPYPTDAEIDASVDHVIAARKKG